MWRRTKEMSAGGVVETLPALSSLADVPDFESLHASVAQQEAFVAAVAAMSEADEAAVRELYLGCVVRLDRGFPAIAWKDGLIRAEFSVGLSKAGSRKLATAKLAGHVGAELSASTRVAVGDWVVLRVPAQHEMGVIEAVLPRESDIARWRGKSRGEKQTLAANVDIVLIALAMGERAVTADRVARPAVVARDCGARVAVILTKVDRVKADELSAAETTVKAVLGADTPLALTSSKAGWGVDAVRALVPAGTVAIVLGESGAGKSSLLNTLLGRESLETGAVRSRDDAGRHTTVARRMVLLPNGGIIVDEPGLRSLPLVGHEHGLSLVFPAIEQAAMGCRFRDCTHTHEPGCAVQEALSDGKFSEEALSAYLALAAEMRVSLSTLDPDVTL
nr:ribosome small subunit-dependent GTPase A [uncultured Olegusella sp.]